MLISSISSSLLISGLSLRSAWPEIAELLIMLAIMTELGVAPIYIWVVDVYGRSSATGLALLASLPKLAAAYALIAIRPAVPAPIPVVLGALSMLIGNLGALTSRELNKILAYSSVLHGGFAVFIYPVNPPLSLAIMLADALGKMSLFYYADGGSAKWASLVIVMNQIGIPPALGFWPKLLIIIAAVEAWGWAAGAYLLANIVMSVPYYIRVFQTIPEGVAKFAFLSAVIVLALGFVPDFWIRYILSL
ncbi:proton-conducting transporter transmembrane domain-containing protein [Pyrobaculum aerophilum]|uniref:proton-conducting transporter transmembrane domain-containing protein n=1 Tax=Pyrobaculum aerophilum TaxID=13773 RepID=UPI002161D86F|nr:proton-conducting transporter membrane subunit [Pyrobaculum aerophilum]